MSSSHTPIPDNKLKPTTVLKNMLMPCLIILLLFYELHAWIQNAALNAHECNKLLAMPADPIGSYWFHDSNTPLAMPPSPTRRNQSLESDTPLSMPPDQVSCYQCILIWYTSFDDAHLISHCSPSWIQYAAFDATYTIHRFQYPRII